MVCHQFERVVYLKAFTELVGEIHTELRLEMCVDILDSVVLTNGKMGLACLARSERTLVVGIVSAVFVID